MSNKDDSKNSSFFPNQLAAVPKTAQAVQARLMGLPERFELKIDESAELERQLGLPLSPEKIPVLRLRPIYKKEVLEKLRALTGTRQPDLPDSDSDLVVLVEIPSNTKDH